MQIEFLIEGAIDRISSEKFYEWCRNFIVNSIRDDAWDEDEFQKKLDRATKKGFMGQQTVDEFLDRKAKEHIQYVKHKIEDTTAPFSGRYKEILINWLIKRIMNYTIEFEDLGVDSKATEYFTNFIKYSPKFKEGQHKDINAYNTLAEIFLAYKPYKDLEQIKLQKDPKTVKNSKVLYEDDTCLIIQPLTPEASCELGKDTEWCTAKYKPDDDRNAFSYYNERGPLYIIFDKEIGQRFQYHQKTSQFMDEDDVPSSRLGHYYPKIVRAATEPPEQKTKWLTDDVISRLRVYFFEDKVPTSKHQKFYKEYSEILDRMEKTPAESNKFTDKFGNEISSGYYVDYILKNITNYFSQMESNRKIKDDIISYVYTHAYQELITSKQFGEP